MNSKILRGILVGLVVLSIGGAAFYQFDRTSKNTASESSQSSVAINSTSANEDGLGASSQEINDESLDDSSTTSSEESVPMATTFNSGTLTEYSGTGGKKCYVAVDGKVYDLTGYSTWVNGTHTQSGGRATCGKNLSSVINQAPHGKAVLASLQVVGTFSN